MTENKFSWQSAFMDSKLPATTKHILHVIGSFMNSHGDGAFPTLETIAKKTGLSLRAVKKHVPIAVESGWLKKGKHGFSGKKWPTNEYNISYPNPQKYIENCSAPGAPYEGNDVVHQVPRCGASKRQSMVHQVHSNIPVNKPVNNDTFNQCDYSFEKWWEIYPRKVGKGAARKSYEKAIKKINEDRLRAITKKYRDVTENKDKQFIPNPSTWLNQERWDDEILTSGPAKVSWML